MDKSEQLNTYLEQFQSIKEISEEDFSTRNNAFVDARTALHNFVEEELPAYLPKLEEIKSEEDVDVTDETIDLYIGAISEIVKESK